MSISNAPQRRQFLITRKQFDEADSLEARWSTCFTDVLRSLNDSSEEESHSILQQKVSQNTNAHRDVNCGLIYGLLIDPNVSEKFFRLLCSISRDGYITAIALIRELVEKKYPKLTETGRTQVFWIIKQFVSSKIHGMDIVCIQLYRNLLGGDVSQENIWLAKQMVSMLLENVDWLLQYTFLFQTAFYNTLRLLLDHGLTQFEALRNQEAELCQLIWQNKMDECLLLGKDLMRVFYEARKVPQIGEIWSRFCNENASMLSKALATRTPKEFLTNRVSIDLATQIKFILTEVKLGSQERYLQWFNQRHLDLPTSLTLLPDIIRFICCTIHPTNQMLASDLTPRYVALGSFLQLAIFKASQMSTWDYVFQSLLALFYDWLFTDQRSTNIMNIEPGALLLVKSLPRYAAISIRIMEFLLKASTEYWPEQASVMRANINHSLHIIASNKVVSSYNVITNSQVLEAALVDQFLAAFPKVNEFGVPRQTQNMQVTTATASPLTTSVSGAINNPPLAPVDSPTLQSSLSTSQTQLRPSSPLSSHIASTTTPTSVGAGSVTKSPATSPVSSPPYIPRISTTPTSPTPSDTKDTTANSDANSKVMTSPEHRSRILHTSSPIRDGASSLSSPQSESNSGVENGFSKSPGNSAPASPVHPAGLISPGNESKITSPPHPSQKPHMPESPNSDQSTKPISFSSPPSMHIDQQAALPTPVMAQSSLMALARKLQKGTTNTTQKEEDLSVYFDSFVDDLEEAVRKEERNAIKFHLNNIFETMFDLNDKTQEHDYDRILKLLATRLWSFIVPTLPELHSSLLSIDLLDDNKIKFENILYHIFSILLAKENDQLLSGQYIPLIRQLLHLLNDNDQSVRPRFACWLLQKKPSNSKSPLYLSPYIGLLESIPTVSKTLLFAQDAEVLFERCPILFSHFLGRAISEIPSLTTMNPKFVKLLCLSCDPEIGRIKSKILTGEATLFQSELQAIAVESLEWDVYAQLVFWDLVRCEVEEHPSLTEQLLDFLCEMDSQEGNDVALCGLLSTLKLQKPTASHVSRLWKIQIDAPTIIGSLLCFWCLKDSTLPKTVAASIRTVLDADRDSETLSTALSRAFW
eukprot:TRINITY_DN3922_c0_g1_i3.p1 TRINITY_DN3922_c0_g1~~TRINITY_DN3922_c0_g1_i3.p1  ORF type:complete len:1096 (-),score=191.72 TRINITY_DN3922_c0_g1_i3:731-4018(-)